MTAGEVMDSVAVLLNDKAKQNWTYEVQIPYLNMAQAELRETMEENNVSMSNETSAAIAVNVGQTNIGGGGIGDPVLPTDLIEIQSLYEALSGSVNQYVLMQRLEFLPLYFVPITDLVYWAWRGQIIRFIGATTDRIVKINYIADKLPDVSSEDDDITLINARSFLQYRTAALCAQFVGEDKERSDDLNVFAKLSLDRFLAINVKGKQSIVIRRRPFMAGYKNRGYIT